MDSQIILNLVIYWRWSTHHLSESAYARCHSFPLPFAFVWQVDAERFAKKKNGRNKNKIIVTNNADEAHREEIEDDERIEWKQIEIAE